MAKPNATQNGEIAPDNAKIVTFADHFDPQVNFKTVAAKGDPLQFSDGTTQQRLAEAFIRYAGTDVLLKGAYICRRDKGGVTTFVLQLPSSGGKFKTPMLHPETERANEQIVQWANSVVGQWKAFRLAEVKSGTTTGTVNAPAQGIGANKDDLAALGL